MARIRTFKGELFVDEKLTECSIDARYCFLGLFPFVDDMGRRQYSARRIKAEVFGCDDEMTVDVVDALVQELEKVGIVEIYEVAKQRYLRIPHFLRHQVINKPGHCYNPPSPTEGPDAIKCLCAKCVSANGKRNKFTERSVNDHVLPEHSVNATGTITEHYRGIGKERSGKELNHLHGESREDIHIGVDDEKSADHRPSREAETSKENRTARYRALTEIARNICSIFEIESNANILDTLIRSIEIRARSKNSTIEAAAQEISARAAWIAGEATPENWQDWFYDARYEYVPQGDKRLKDRSIEARPVCGGSRCTEGWETVKIGETSVSRRCPDCVRLWIDAGV